MNPTERFNLLVTFKGHKTSSAGEELLGIEEIELTLQDEKNLFDIKETEFQNVVLIESGSDPLMIAKELADASTTVISKIVPIELVIRTRPDIIAEKAITLSKDKIKSGETFIVRGDVRGREYIKSKEKFLASTRSSWSLRTFFWAMTFSGLIWSAWEYASRAAWCSPSSVSALPIRL